MSHPRMVRWFARIYRALLFTYPRQFRLEYGGEMERMFRDRCGDVARENDPLKLVLFVVQSGVDWVATSVRERAESMRGVISTARKSAPRGFVSEWVVTILMYLFATTTLVQAYVVPTGSMEGTIRVGDHMLVDRAVYATPGSVGHYLMPYREVKRGDLVAFLYPETRDRYLSNV